MQDTPPHPDPTSPRIEKGRWVFPEPRRSSKPRKRKPKNRGMSAVERQPIGASGPDARPFPQRGASFAPGTRAYGRLQRSLEQTAYQPGDPRSTYRRKVKRK